MPNATLFLTGPQKAAFDQGRNVGLEVFAPKGAVALSQLIDLGNFESDRWNADLIETLDVAKMGVFERTESERDQTTESAELKFDVAAGTKLIGVAIKTLELAVRRENQRQAAKPVYPPVREAANLAEQIRMPEDSFRQVDGELAHVYVKLMKCGDLARFGFKPGFLDECKAVLANSSINLAELVNAQLGIQVGADIVHKALLRLIDLMDELNECRELASLHLGYELPGYDMRLIRAAVAGNTPNNPAPNASEEPAPDDKVNGL